MFYYSEGSSNGSDAVDSEDKLRKLRASFEEKISALERERAKAEAETRKKYKDLVISAAEKQMKVSEASTLKYLGVLHERECAEALKRIEAQASDQIRPNADKDKDEKLRYKPNSMPPPSFPSLDAATRGGNVKKWA